MEVSLRQDPHLCAQCTMGKLGRNMFKTLLTKKNEDRLKILCTPIVALRLFSSLQLCG